MPDEQGRLRATVVCTCLLPRPTLVPVYMDYSIEDFGISVDFLLIVCVVL